ncbi:MAG TPA: DUF3105 domain-containing protein [Thermomicrobiales bacterium]|nr:DUF3105 domain-containing protein [Thermomicrobiales bacterium]
MSTENSRTMTPTRKMHGDASAAQRWKKWIILIFAVMIAVAVINAYMTNRRPWLPDEVAGVTTYSGLSNEIVDGPVDYDMLPPAGGPHAELAQLCGFYRVPVEDENVVASLATGAVWVTHDPDISEADYEILRDMVEGEYDVLLTPYPGLEHEFVLTAWERQLALDDVHDERAELFVHVYQNRDWAPNVDDSCSAGVGLPAPTP